MGEEGVLGWKGGGEGWKGWKRGGEGGCMSASLGLSDDSCQIGLPVANPARFLF